MLPERCDLLFAGAGLSGLTLAMELLRYPAFQTKEIVLIDRESKDRNDRTWCFWAKKNADIPPVLYKTWDHCHFYGPGFEEKLDLGPYRYHMIRSADFYRWARETLQQHANVRFVQASVQRWEADTGLVYTTAGNFQADLVFNSAFIPQSLLAPPNGLYPNPGFTGQDAPEKPSQAPIHLLQHFKGWIIETVNPVFDPESATLMDYRIEQCGQTRFVYVLPFSPQRALVEFTVFSDTLCEPLEYDQALRDYISHFLGISDYTIAETETGIIPMSDFHPETLQEGRIVHIGTGAGFVKASSGYAFTRTRRKLAHFAANWAEKGQPDTNILHSPWRFRFYDSVLLRVLQGGYIPGAVVFTRLFSRLAAPAVFRFLDEDTRLGAELRLMDTVPKWPFIKAAWKQLPHLLRL